MGTKLIYNYILQNAQMPQQVKSNNLKIGMSYSEIRSELTDRVSGETSQELQLFFKQDGALEKQYPMASMENSHSVVMEADGYALILTHATKPITETATIKITKAGVVKYEYDRQVIKKGWFGTGIGEKIKQIKKPIMGDVVVEEEEERIVRYDLVKTFWLVGVNDEKHYFVHRLEGIPPEATKKMEDILAWLNRHDEGFLKRLQGDLLIMYIPYSAADDSGSELDIARPELEDADANDYELSQITLGSHILSCIEDGDAPFNGLSVFDDKYVLVGGRGVIIQHGQHGLLQHEFPPGHYGLITGQRGRSDLSIEKNQGFD